VFAVYTRKRDVTRRLEHLLLKEGIRVEILTAEVPPADREAGTSGIFGTACKSAWLTPSLCSVGLDLLDFPVLLFYETGYSTYTLRQASRRSWRIGQKRRFASDS